MNKSNKSITDKGFTLMDNFRENINSYIGNMTLSELSERAGIPFSTLRGMLYENSSDCNLSNAVKLAKVFSISVDELFGANTMEERTTDCLNTCRELPENSRYLISWFIQHQKTLNSMFFLHGIGSSFVPLCSSSTISYKLSVPVPGECCS